MPRLFKEFVVAFVLDAAMLKVIAVRRRGDSLDGREVRVDSTRDYDIAQQDITVHGTANPNKRGYGWRPTVKQSLHLSAGTIGAHASDKARHYFQRQAFRWGEVESIVVASMFRIAQNVKGPIHICQELLEFLRKSHQDSEVYVVPFH